MKWRWDRMCDALARGLKNLGDSRDDPPLVLLWIAFWALGVILSIGVGAALSMLPMLATDPTIATTIGLWTLAQAPLGVWVLYVLRKGCLARELPYGWVRTNEQRWMEAKRNTRDGWVEMHRMDKIHNPHRGDQRWIKVLKISSGKPYARREFMVDEDGQQLLNEPDNFWTMEMQQGYDQIEAATDEPEPDDPEPIRTPEQEVVTGVEHF